MKYLLDTCVLSEFVKNKQSDDVRQWFYLHSDACFISVVSIGEIQKGIAKLNDSKRKKAIETHLKKELIPFFAGKILNADIDVFTVWGEMLGNGERTGQPLPVVDALVAAIAQTNRMVVVTRNTADFLRCGVKTINPWKDQRGA